MPISITDNRKDRQFFLEIFQITASYNLIGLKD